MAANMERILPRLNIIKFYLISTVLQNRKLILVTATNTERILSRLNIFKLYLISTILGNSLKRLVILFIGMKC